MILWAADVFSMAHPSEGLPSTIGRPWFETLIRWLLMFHMQRRATTLTSNVLTATLFAACIKCAAFFPPFLGTLSYVFSIFD